MTAVAGETEATRLSPVAPPARRVRARGRFFLVVGLLCAAIAVLLYKGLVSSLNYYETVDYALAHRGQLGTSSFRLEGVVVRGSIRASAAGATFSISGADCKEVKVVNVGSPPGLFQPGIPVVVVGQFSSATSATFDSNQILVKHSATYIAAHPGRVTVPEGEVC